MIQFFFWIWAIAMASNLGNTIWPIVLYPLFAAGIVILTVWYVTKTI